MLTRKSGKRGDKNKFLARLWPSFHSHSPSLCSHATASQRRVPAGNLHSGSYKLYIDPALVVCVLAERNVQSPVGYWVGLPCTLRALSNANLRDGCNRWRGTGRNTYLLGYFGFISGD